MQLFLRKTCDQQYIILRDLKLESSLCVDNLFFVGDLDFVLG